MSEYCYSSPFGPIRVEAEGGRLCRVILLSGRTQPPAEPPTACAPYVEMLDGYFAGRPIACPAEMLSLDGVSAFHRRAYEALRAVPFGATVSYADLSRMCGRPGAARAVGQAMRANPLPLFVPCHRVVRTDGTPGGFRAGPAWKARLLAHERK